MLIDCMGPETDVCFQTCTHTGEIEFDLLTVAANVILKLTLVIQQHVDLHNVFIGSTPVQVDEQANSWN